MENSGLESRGVEPRASDLSAVSAASGMGTWDAHANDSDLDVHPNVVVEVVGGAIPTQETYSELQWLYDFFNRHLFDNRLPNCLITLQGNRGTYGYFDADRFARNDGRLTDHIALNPRHLARGTIEESLSTLGHEMCHLKQHHFGKPGRGRYHNKEWAAMMRDIGLIPSDTGKPGGKQTGDTVSHYIEPGGRFAHAVERLLPGGFDLTWREVTANKVSSGGVDGSDPGNEPASLSGKRTRYDCPHPECTLKAWAKAGASLLCGKHGGKMEPVDSGASSAEGGPVSPASPIPLD